MAYLIKLLNSELNNEFCIILKGRVIFDISQLY